MDIRQASNNEREQIIGLLLAEKLPVDDLPADLGSFWVAASEGELAGAIGMEAYNDSALLRSMVVAPAHRNKGIADQLVRALEHSASARGMDSIYLLTETAPKYFERKGYAVTSRDEVPEALKASSEFTHVCPSSAIVMKKHLQ